MQRKNEIPKDMPWEDDALATYKDFLIYAGKEVNQGVEYNRHVIPRLQFFNPQRALAAEPAPAEPEIKVEAKDGKFYPCTSQDARPFYCNKLVIRNFQQASFVFRFEDDIVPRSVGIETDNEGLKLAYRNIVPSEFSQARSLAGPMGFHEYILDGENAKGEPVFISFYANSDRQVTPLKIVLENCQGICSVQGLKDDAKAIAEVFINKCDNEALDFYPAYNTPRPK